MSKTLVLIIQVDNNVDPASFTERLTQMFHEGPLPDDQLADLCGAVEDVQLVGEYHVPDIA